LDPGFTLPGLTAAETKKVVQEAGRLEALVQRATPAQKKLLESLAQQSGDLQYAVPAADWIELMLTATANISDEDLKYLQTLDWEPGILTAEELRSEIIKALERRGRQQPAEPGAPVPVASSEKKSKKKRGKGSTSKKPKKKPLDKPQGIGSTPKSPKQKALDAELLKAYATLDFSAMKPNSFRISFERALRPDDKGQVLVAALYGLTGRLPYIGIAEVRVDKPEGVKIMVTWLSVYTIDGQGNELSVSDYEVGRTSEVILDSPVEAFPK
jgi:hypothetical protein